MLKLCITKETGWRDIEKFENKYLFGNKINNATPNKRPNRSIIITV